VNRSRLCFAMVYFVFFVSSKSIAQDLADVTFRSGVAFGTITFINDDDDVVTGAYGGIPLGGIWNRGFSRRASLVLGGSVLLDLINSQLIKQGFVGGVAWHVLGGPRKYSIEGRAAGFSTTTQSSLSLTTYGGLQNFAATDAANPKTRVSGSVFEVDLGLEYRYDFSDENAATVEFITSVFTLPASVSRIKPTSTELLFGWRTFI
jgi:hypothetical protein